MSADKVTGTALVLYEAAQATEEFSLSVSGTVSRGVRTLEWPEGESRSVGIDSAIIAGKGSSESWNPCCERAIWQLAPFANDHTQM